eukprot:SAG22_NODE_282_length_13050_cov_37.625125_8_plen_248_part_00
MAFFTFVSVSMIFAASATFELMLCFATALGIVVLSLLVADLDDPYNGFMKIQLKSFVEVVQLLDKTCVRHAEKTLNRRRMSVLMSVDPTEYVDRHEHLAPRGPGFDRASRCLCRRCFTDDKGAADRQETVGRPGDAAAASSVYSVRTRKDRGWSAVQSHMTALARLRAPSFRNDSNNAAMNRLAGEAEEDPARSKIGGGGSPPARDDQVVDEFIESGEMLPPEVTGGPSFMQNRQRGRGRGSMGGAV